MHLLVPLVSNLELSFSHATAVDPALSQVTGKNVAKRILNVPYQISGYHAVLYLVRFATCFLDSLWDTVPQLGRECWERCCLRELKPTFDAGFQPLHPCTWASRWFLKQCFLLASQFLRHLERDLCCLQMPTTAHPSFKKQRLFLIYTPWFSFWNHWWRFRSLRIRGCLIGLRLMTWQGS